MRAVLRRFYGPDCDTDAIMDALHAQAETAFQAPPPKKPGLDELIAYLEAQHIPMVVASSSRMASILRHLQQLEHDRSLQGPHLRRAVHLVKARPGDLPHRGQGAGHHPG